MRGPPKKGTESQAITGALMDVGTWGWGNGDGASLLGQEMPHCLNTDSVGQKPPNKRDEGRDMEVWNTVGLVGGDP